MNFTKIKKFTFALTLALGFAGAPGLSNVRAQVEPQPRPLPQEKGREQLEKRVTMEERDAFRAGFRMGQADARSGRRYDYNKSRLYRTGDREYREDFRKGYARGYHRG
jgi:hypothetical protein